MRLLILMGVIYLGYRALKSWMIGGGRVSGTLSGSNSGQIDDIMVKDPFCDTYFPKRNGVRLKHKGEDLFFCSAECRDKFSKRHS